MVCMGRAFQYQDVGVNTGVTHVLPVRGVVYLGGQNDYGIATIKNQQSLMELERKAVQLCMKPRTLFSGDDCSCLYI